jgi:hypothetical protein
VDQSMRSGHAHLHNWPGTHDRHILTFHRQGASAPWFR